MPGGGSPFEKLFGRVPSISKLRPFGCLAFMLLDESKRKKLDTKSRKIILLANLDHGNYLKGCSMELAFLRTDFTIDRRQLVIY
jgi:hypothetical protein